MHKQADNKNKAQDVVYWSKNWELTFILSDQHKPVNQNLDKTG